ncbi:MAG: selenocysteine synthase [Woeseia sp.]|nr:selenocysteine synthase [Woeseia sp.]
MWPEVIEAMDYAIKHKIRVSELHDAVGKRLAKLLGAESAMVSAGATSAIMLGTAACMTMGDKVNMERLPNTDGVPNEVIILKNHRYLYDRSIKAPGARLVEVETEEDIRAAINNKTAMMFYLLNRPQEQKIELGEYIALAQEFNIPSFCDAATTVPPISNIFNTLNTGFDLVCYSGGKGLRGPYSAGLLLGRADLISFARLHGSPNHRAYGRSMKVAPEEYLGMLVAVETSLRFDEDAEYERQRNAVDTMAHRLKQVPGLIVETKIPAAEAREPYVEVRWDSDLYKITPAEMKKELREGFPSIEVRALFLSDGELHLTAVMLKPGEPEVVTNRVIEILENNASH